MKVLLNHKCTVDPQDHEGITPLYLTTYYGNYEVMKMLVVAFADVNAVTKVIIISEIFTNHIAVCLVSSTRKWESLPHKTSFVPRSSFVAAKLTTTLEHQPIEIDATLE